MTNKPTSDCWCKVGVSAFIVLTWMTIFAGYLTVTTKYFDVAGTDENCQQGTFWYPQNATVYLPGLMHFSDWYPSGPRDVYTLLQKNVIAKRFHTVITDCPFNRGTNFTEAEFENAKHLANAKNNTTSNMTELSVWFVSGYKTSGLGLACRELAHALNQMQPGTIQGIVTRVEQTLEELEMDDLFNRNSDYYIEVMNKSNKSDDLKFCSIVGREKYLRAVSGLQEGMLISHAYCFDFEKNIDEDTLRNTSAFFYLEECSPRFTVKNGMPRFTLSKNYRECRHHLGKRIVPKLVVPEGCMAKGEFVTRPYCLLEN